TADTKAMGVKLADNTYVPAELMSEGLLYYLAFAILPYLEPTPILLIEEPENGLHPARIVEVMRILRAISEKTQILIATHSPLVDQSNARPGVLHLLLEKVQPTGWEVTAARTWASIRKVRVGRSEHRDEHNVLAIALDAKEAGCDVLAFSRDRDRDYEREAAV